jgi:hypothetical protein
MNQAAFNAWIQNQAANGFTNDPIVRQQQLAQTQAIQGLQVASTLLVNAEVNATIAFAGLAAGEFAAPYLSSVVSDVLGETAETGTTNFFKGTSYSNKVLQQMEGGVAELRLFPESVTAFEDSGTVSTITGGDGQTYQMLEIPGSYTSSSGNLYDGTFQFIKDSDGVINHRLFVPTSPGTP